MKYNNYCYIKYYDNILFEINQTRIIVANWQPVSVRGYEYVRYYIVVLITLTAVLPSTKKTNRNNI